MHVPLATADSTNRIWVCRDCSRGAHTINKGLYWDKPEGVHGEHCEWVRFFPEEELKEGVLAYTFTVETGI